MPDPDTVRASLQKCLDGIGDCAVAVSGGVDSMTLAVVTHRHLDRHAQMFHAVSPAVPPDATERVRRYAAAQGWRLSVVDAGEIADPRYVANPANRCYFCKTNLYGTMARAASGTLLSGTNLDDLGDFRPGLGAAEEHAVRHPYVEVGIDKRGVRAIAASLGLHDLAELPAAPCLSSRVETGIAIDARVLRVIDACEKLIRAELSPHTVRCRVRSNRVVVELDSSTLESLAAPDRRRLSREIGARFAAVGTHAPVAYAAYRMGSAFLRPPR